MRRTGGEEEQEEGQREHCWISRVWAFGVTGGSVVLSVMKMAEDGEGPPKLWRFCDPHRGKLDTPTAVCHCRSLPRRGKLTPDFQSEPFYTLKKLTSWGGDCKQVCTDTARSS